MLHTLLCLLPILAVAVPLLAKRYPGERALLALHPRRRRRLPRASHNVSSFGRAVVVAVRGGELIGRSLAVRPPPPLLPAS